MRCPSHHPKNKNLTGSNQTDPGRTNLPLLEPLFSGDDQQAEAVVLSLVQAGENEKQAACFDLDNRLASANLDSDGRWWALRALAEIPCEQTLTCLVAYLKDADPGVRQCAAMGLRKNPDQRVIPDLIAMLDDSDGLCADLAADTLIEIGSPSVTALLEVMQGCTTASRLRAVRALALIKDPRAVPALFTALDEDSAVMEFWANEGLEQMRVGMKFFKPD
jgi:HEAT repeat protein